MNKYSDKSDFEINKAVAVQLDNDGKITSWAAVNGIMVGIAGEEYAKKFDPCNNPVDAMPIVFENGISLISDWNEIGVWGATCQPWVSSENKNPLRAAMEVFLMMKDAENES